MGSLPFGQSLAPLALQPRRGPAWTLVILTVSRMCVRVTIKGGKRVRRRTRDRESKRVLALNKLRVHQERGGVERFVS